MNFAPSAASPGAAAGFGHATGRISLAGFAGLAALTAFPNDTVIDAEIVALDENRGPLFALLQVFGTDAPEIVLYAAILLMLRGKDRRLWPREVVAPNHNHRVLDRWACDNQVTYHGTSQSRSKNGLR
jgi:hypothetical protein